MNFNFGTPKTTATSTLNFGSGDNKGLTPQNQTPAKPTGFGLNFNTPTTSAPGFNFGGSTLGGTPLGGTTLGGSNLGGTPATTAPTLNFNTPNTVTPAFPVGTPASTATAKTSALGGFSLSTPATTSSAAPLGTGFSLGGTPATSAPTGLTFSGLGSSTGLSLGSTTTTTASTGFPLGKSASTSLATPSLPTATNTIAGATTQVASTTSTPGSTVNFNQIEEILNKWTLELEEQGKVFINQALQLNAWDRLVIANGEKILNLNSGIEKVKQQQQQLDHELEFVLIQQRELEECIAPLEKELKDIPIADHDRNHTYQMAENMDTQLKQMSEDLKEIIEHLNESNRSEDNNDPVSQIGRILNAHMNSLQWIDRNTAQISTLLDQITKMHDMHRRDNERSFHLTYE